MGWGNSTDVALSQLYNVLNEMHIWAGIYSTWGWGWGDCSCFSKDGVEWRFLNTVFLPTLENRCSVQVIIKKVCL